MAASKQQGKGLRKQALPEALYTSNQIYARGKLQGWGRFVATHQVAVLLLCCVFLCTLTYPVLSLYAWTAPATTSDFFSFLRTSPTWTLVGADGGIARARDLKLPWQDLDALILNAEEACWQRIPKFREISVQQILVGFPADGAAAIASEHGVLDRRALHSVHKLERKLRAVLSNSSSDDGESLRCARLHTGQEIDSENGCFTLSPMAYWNNDENAMLSDTSLIATVNLAERRYNELPLRQDVLFSGRVRAGTTMRKADYAVITLFLQEAPRPDRINNLVISLAQDLDIVLVEQSKPKTQAVMKHRSDVRIRPVLWEDVLFYLGYVVVGIYIYSSLRGIDKVHSRSGLIITGLVQMMASGLMSLSLCALGGYKINLGETYLAMQVTDSEICIPNSALEAHTLPDRRSRRGQYVRFKSGCLVNLHQHAGQRASGGRACAERREHLFEPPCRIGRALDALRRHPNPSDSRDGRLWGCGTHDRLDNGDDLFHHRPQR